MQDCSNPTDDHSESILRARIDPNHLLVSSESGLCRDPQALGCVADPMLRARHWKRLSLDGLALASDDFRASETLGGPFSAGLGHNEMSFWAGSTVWGTFEVPLSELA